MKQWQLWLSLLISALFLWLALAGLDLASVWRSMRAVQVGWLVPAMLAYFVTVAVRTWRWAYLLRPVRPIRLPRLFPVMVLGYLANNLYPFRVGELLRAYLVRRREALPISASLATIVVERIFDGLAILTLVFVALPFAPLPGVGLQRGLLLASAAFGGALLAFLLLAARPQLAQAVAGRVISWLPVVRLRAPLLGMSQRFLGGLAALRSGRAVAATFLASLVIWLVEVGKFWLVMQAFPFAVSFFVLLLMNGVVNMATILPSAPGYVGTFDAPGIAVLVLYGVAEGPAGAFTLVLHFVLWLPSVLVGLLFMVREGIHWSDFGRAARMSDPAG